MANFTTLKMVYQRNRMQEFLFEKSDSHENRVKNRYNNSTIV